MAGEDEGDVSFESVDGTFDHGFALLDDFGVQGVALFEEGGAVDDEVGFLDEGGSIGGGDVFGMGLEVDMGVEVGEFCEDGFDA